MLSRAEVRARPSVLWCYKKELLLSSHRKKRLKQMKKMMQRGLLDPEKEDPFALFMASTAIRYCYYAETHKILGNTFGMCVLQVCQGAVTGAPSLGWGGCRRCARECRNAATGAHPLGVRGCCPRGTGGCEGSAAGGALSEAWLTMLIPEDEAAMSQASLFRTQSA